MAQTLRHPDTCLIGHVQILRELLVPVSGLVSLVEEDATYFLQSAN
ncbi:MAG: hypothetical protein H9993_03500 [Candidatus Desulfovibrio faecigallinarum]|nr:hypothetical protein [Desulfovibrio sp. An276]MBU3831759.1 hypothetical protein [Candidatus Desulfovibrio faecigallinarum]